MRQNPKHYKIDGISQGGDTDKRLEEVCERDIKLLQECSLVSKDERFSCTEYGEAMSRYMIQYDTMKLLLSIPPQAKTEQIVSRPFSPFEQPELNIEASYNLPSC
jgi:ATP-dependent DNA helicase HFM1/MER3